ncbi:proline-rich receptor-like protein kinase PERK15 [Curcuma longa]|uniref:proline-rich receptor-like protein kinase PERK15 n=1 Tax=Curcuma longa TaxID=136217 RepID=UPI003D9E5FDE
MASTPAAAPPPTNSSDSDPPPTNSSASSTSPPTQPSPPPQSPSPSPPPPPPSPSPPPKSPLPASSPPLPNSPTASRPPPSSPPPNPSSSSSVSPPPPKSGDVWSPPPPPSSNPKPPPSHKPPSSADGSDTPSENRHSGNSGASLPVLIGVTVGVGVLLVLMLFALVLCCSNKKKKKKKPMAMDYYGTPGPNGAGGFNNGGSHLNWQYAEQRTDYRSNLPSPPGATAFSPWHQPPPPPQTYSGSMSSTSSGPHSGGGGGTGAALPPLSPNLGFSKSSFTYEALSAATNAFSRDNILGQGGFGFVFKGVLPNGVPVAVKQLKSGSGQGEREFQAEVEIISRVHHRHLVSLVGYCIAGAQRMLVYEFVPNGTLEYHLHVNNNRVMDWSTRLKIAIGSAKGLAYLHEDCHPRIIHRDIKTANILLDDNFDAMVADFGLAKFNSDTNTHVSTRIMGTFGYLAPEYASTGKLTEKSDVFSFGVMLLELITGRRPVDLSGYMEDSLVDWSRPILTQALIDKNFDELVDKRLENKYNVEEMIRMATSAAACVQHSARKRPKMSQVVRGLEGDVSLDNLGEGVKSSNINNLNSSLEFDSSDTHSSKMREFRRVAFESNEYSDEHNGGDIKHGLNS